MDHTGSIGSDAISTMRLYGSAIALVSGVYSIVLATTGMRMSGAAWVMLVIGIVAIVHGVVLVSPLASRLGRASGPLMIVYATVMLLNQGWMVTMRSPMGGGMQGGMGGGSMGSGMGTASAMGWDPGMVAIAVLMLTSGVIMTMRSEMLPDDSM